MSNNPENSELKATSPEKQSADDLENEKLKLEIRMLGRQLSWRGLALEWFQVRYCTRGPGRRGCHTVGWIRTGQAVGKEPCSRASRQSAYPIGQ